MSQNSFKILKASLMKGKHIKNLY